MLWDTSSLAMTTIGSHVPFTTGSPSWMFGSISIRSVSSQVVETFAREIRFGVGGLRPGLLLVEGLPLRATGSTEVRVAWAPTAKPARRKAPPAQRTSRSLPVSTSNTNPRMASLWGMNGLLSRRATL